MRKQETQNEQERNIFKNTTKLIEVEIVYEKSVE